MGWGGETESAEEEYLTFFTLPVPSSGMNVLLWVRDGLVSVLDAVFLVKTGVLLRASLRTNGVRSFKILEKGAQCY